MSTPDDDLRQALVRTLEGAPGLTAKDLAQKLDAAKKDVNRVLHANSDLFRCTAVGTPRWRLKQKRQATADRTASRSFVARLHDPYPWQAEALSSWRTNGRRGVVEAVTGAGKTTVALHAAAEELRAGGKVVVLTPNIALKDQWVSVLSAAFPTLSIGQRGDGRMASLRSFDALVSVLKSAGTNPYGPMERGLLIADEVHHCGSETGALALDPKMQARLGLTATLERSDDGVSSVIVPYFGDSCYRLGYRRAITDGILSRYRVALVGVEPTPPERRRYDELSEQIRRSRQLLESHLGFAEPFSDFMAAVHDLRVLWPDRAAKTAGRLIGAMSERRDLLADSSARWTAVQALLPALADSRHGLVFCEKVDQAEQISWLMRAADIDAAALHSGLNPSERRLRLEQFASGDLQAIAAPRVLDEGIDVPDADLAVVVSSSRSRRQMIQRMGRVLRLKDGGRGARFVILYMVDTIEDPAGGAHEAFLDEVIESAESWRNFRPGWTSDELRTWLKD